MNRTTEIILGIVIVVVVVSYLGYLLSRAVPTRETNIKIGAVLPLSGDLAKYGKGMSNTLSLGREEMKKIYPEFAIEFILEDDFSCGPKEAVTAVQKLINVDKVNAIIGTACSSPLLAAASVIEEGRIITISPSATSPSITDAGDYVFRVIASDGLKSVEIATFAFNKGHRKAALLTDVVQDSLILQSDILKKSFTELGGEIVIEESFKTKDIDFRTQLIKVKESEADVVFFSAIYKETVSILKQARELGIDLPFMTSETSMEDPDLISIAGETAEGLIFPFSSTPENQKYSQFIKDYKKRYGEEPPAYSAETYDALFLTVKAIKEGEGEKEKIKDKLYEVGQGYMGASGEITFDENGDVSKPFIIKTIKNGQFTPLENQ